MRRTSTAGALIGRGQELAQLRAGLADAEMGRGRLFVITGDAGIGKTRLLEALVEDTGTDQARAVWGRCWEAGGATAYRPVVQVLRESIDHTPPDRLDLCLGLGASDVAQLVPELSSRLPGVMPGVPINSPQARVRLFHSVIAFLAAVAAEGPPLLVAVEDLHAADEASLKLFRSLARSLTDTRLLFVGTYRDAEVGTSSDRQRLLSAIASEGHTITLAGLDHLGIARLLEATSGRVPTLDLVTEVQQLTEGNPLFVGEVARVMASEGRRGTEAVPLEVHTLVRRRLEPMASHVRQVLEAAAVVGQEFELSVLRHLVAVTHDDLLDALAQAADLRVVDEVALGRWSFAHSLVREALYERLEAEERASLHRHAGEVLEELFGSGAGPHLSQLAHHFFAACPAGEPERAVAHCQKAAASAMAVLAYEDAALWYRRALDALDEVTGANDRHRYDLLMACADAEWRSSGFGQARESYAKAVRVAQALGDGELVGRAALGFAQGGGPEHWAPVLQRALTFLAGSAHVVRSQVSVELSLCKLILNEGDTPRWVARARRDLQNVRRSGDPDAIWTTLWSFHRALQFDPQALGERLAVSSELLHLAELRDNGEQLFRARSYRISDLFDTGDIAAVEQELDALDDDARHVRLQYFDWVVAYMRAAVALHRGRIDEAEELAHRALAVGEAVESTEVENIFACQMLEIRRQQGRFEEMRALARSAQQQFPHEFLVPLALAVALAELGCADQARQELRRSPATRNPEALSGTRAVAAWTYLTDVAWATGDAEPAPVLEELLRPHAGRHVTLAVAGASLGSTDRSLGRLAALQRRWEGAEAWFASAHASHRRVEAPAWLAHGKVDHARMLLARRGDGDDRRAFDLLSEARAELRELGIAFHAQRASDLLDEIGTEGRSVGIKGSFRQEADGWVLEYGGTMVRLHESKGLRYLARLLTHPGRQFSAVELIENDGPIDVERARHRVIGAVRSAIDRVADSHPILGEHLRTTVRVGTKCSYVPDARTPVIWNA